MRHSHQIALLIVWCTTITLIRKTDSFLFRRKEFHQMLHDPYQLKPEKITSANLFKWMNMKSYVRFKVWTRKNPRWAQEIKIGDMESLNSTNYDFRRLTKVLVHGWAHSANEIYIEDWIFAMRDAYLRLADLNILIIDYSIFALPFMYWTTGPLLAGNVLTEFIEFLVRNGADCDHFHLLGYSWGAHGIAGQKLNGTLNRITGLDPANPTFQIGNDIHRLDSNDAKYVDIIHSGGGPFTSGHLGLFAPLGHADFYPNGGRFQPGCAMPWEKLYDSIECDHGRAVWYFVESINSPFAFSSCRCSNWEDYLTGNCPCTKDDITYMGEHTSHTKQGKYYLFTKSDKPFGMGTHFNLSLQSMDEYDPTWSELQEPNHSFTRSSAMSYLSMIFQKSRTKLQSVNYNINDLRRMESVRGSLMQSGSGSRTEQGNKNSVQNYHIPESVQCTLEIEDNKFKNRLVRKASEFKSNAFERFIIPHYSELP